MPGFDPDDSTIEKVRSHLDLTAELLNHGYLPVAGKRDVFLYSGSETRVPGVHIMRSSDGIERVYSHHSGDPLAPGNLPSWCLVKAIDVVDVVTILDHGGDQKKALRTLAKKFDIKTPRRPATAASAPLPTPGPKANGEQGVRDDAEHDPERPRDVQQPTGDAQNAAGASEHDDPAGPQADGPADVQQPGKDDAGAAGPSESEYARILKIIMSATPKTVVDALISALLQSDFTPTDEIRLIKITSVQSDDGETHATIPAIKRQLKQARDRLARDKAETDHKAQQQAKHEAQQQQRQQNVGSAYGRILALIQAAKPEATVPVLSNELLRSDLTPSEQDLLIKAAKLRSGAGIRGIRDQLQQARDAQRKAQQQQRGHGVAPPSQVAEVIAEFNGRYFVVNEGGRALIWEPTRDPMLNNRIYYQRSKPWDLRTFYMNRMVQVGETKEGEPIRENAANVWLSHSDREQYIHGIVFDPSGTERPGVYNLWQGFHIKPEEGSWQKMQDHLLIVVCAGNRHHYRYLRKWLARMVQFPAKQGEVAVVLRGLEGTGKSILGDAMRRIFGQHGFAISNPVHLVGKFNDHLRDCVLLFADEAFLPNDRHHVGVLKALITSPI